MKLRYQFILSLSICLLMASSVIAREAVKISSKTRNLSTNKQSSSEVYISANEVAIKGTKETILFDASSDVFSYIDHSKKEYYQFDKATLVQLKSQIKMFAQMLKQFSSQMPEEQKKKLDKVLNPGGQPEIKYVKSGSGQKVRRWTTDHYKGIAGDEQLVSLYIASFSQVGVSESKFDAMKRMLLFAEENLKEVAGLLPAGKTGSWSQVSVGDDSPILSDGIPVKTVSYESGAAADENVIETIAISDAPDTLFKVPSGYVRKRIDLQSQLK